MKLPAAAPLLVLCLLCAPSCRTGKKKKNADDPVPAMTRDLAVLGDSSPSARPGTYYKMKMGMNGFYYRIPSFIEAVPNKFLMGGHVVLLLDSAVGDGWARVKNEDMATGYVRMENIKIVPPDQQPAAPKRDPDKELDMSMGLE